MLTRRIALSSGVRWMIRTSSVPHRPRDHLMLRHDCSGQLHGQQGFAQHLRLERQLQWPPATAKPAVHALTGITFLELLANFVVCTGRLPPLRVDTSAKPGWVDLVDCGGILRPVVLRDVLLGFLAAVKSLDKLLGIRCWPSQRHHRLHCLTIFGHRDGRKGLLLRPKLPCLKQTGDVVSKLVETGCGEVLREVALKWRLPS